MDTPPLPHRKTIRLQNYDYSQNGAYFVTICTAQRQPILGKLIPPTSNAVGATLAVARLCRSMRSCRKSVVSWNHI